MPTMQVTVCVMCNEEAVTLRAEGGSQVMWCEAGHVVVVPGGEAPVKLVYDFAKPSAGA